MNMKTISWILTWILGCGTGFVTSSGAADPVRIGGERMTWHAVTLTFAGPQTNERADPNPFLDYRLIVTFTQGDKRIAVPGYYAADGDAAQTGGDAGPCWRVHFVAETAGPWSYRASFRTGRDIALDDDPQAGSPIAFDGAEGRFSVADSDKSGRDFRGQGFLRHGEGRYLQFAGSQAYFLKGGADSPENFLAFADFDATYDTAELKRPGEAAGDIFLHTYEPHVRDWRPSDPTWKNGRGKGIIGALNYLAAKGMNSVYFLPFNIDGGDGKDVWPWIGPEQKTRFDCSKLDQWEIVFSHMDRLGLMLHVVTQEQENDQALDGGELGDRRQLYYRELIARFAHHLGLTWNLGEENTNTDAQRRAFCRYIKQLDPYGHPIVCHTFPGQYDKVYKPLLGYEYFDGPSLQTNDTHNQTKKWIDASKRSGREWFVSLDEIGPAHIGAKPDAVDFAHDEVRRRHLWGHLMAGGAGVEWYFGYQYAHNDLNCEDWRSRDHLWDLTRYALEFFGRHLPFARMDHHDELTDAEQDYCLARPGEIYAVYLPRGETTLLDLGENDGAFSVQWYDPRRGGELADGTATEIRGPGKASIGRPPAERDQDWVALVRRK